MPTALITGLYGQDGSLLAELLLGRGYRVIGVVRPGAGPDAERAALAGRCTVLEIDLADPGRDWANELVAREKPDEIYHLAACHRSSEPGLRDDPAQQQRMVVVNHVAALALANAVLAARHGRLVCAGSSQMYMPATPPARIDERTQRAPATFYGITKAACMDALAWLRTQQGLFAATAILFNHESTRRSPAFASRKITRAAARIAAGLERELALADAWSLTDFSSARDVVEGLHAIAIAPAPADRVLASGELHSLADVCEVAFRSVGLDWRDHVRSGRPPGERAALVGDPSSAERDLGWLRTRPFAAWVEEMVTADRRRC